ncbi:NUDIX domain-containing protein [Bacillus cereus group sp. N12]|uniref:bis(5'-nucleosyl)-tetraphosphatase n=1 Tax=Bacillus cereus group TaxID=86661 RepID=UPI000BED6258|nr:MULTISPECIES: NUDIX domain-containing protein [Bacillus cereus group]MBJ8078140.1 NUDIX domain-containing protein [Bacillus cereus group sp. N12]PDY81823.1 NUDIX hydrolase [Bacillus toyonensis]
MQREKSCGVIIYQDKPDTRYLIVKSKANGHWGFPKGHIEENETEIDTARREVKEETGLDVLIHEDFKTSMEYEISETTRKEVILFLGTPMSTSVTIQEGEIAMYKWATFTDTLNLFDHENQKQILKQAHEFLNKKLS